MKPTWRPTPDEAEPRAPTNQESMALRIGTVGSLALACLISQSDGEGWRRAHAR
jgi:hypothetical protein